MKRTLSLRAMLIGLFLAAILGSVVLAATGLLSNQRLIGSQRFIIGEVLPQQEASRGMVDIMGQFSLRHSGLLAAQTEEDLGRLLSRERLDEAFRHARGGLRADGDAEPASRLASLDDSYGTLLEADQALERVRREDVALGAIMGERIDEMESRITEVMNSTENMAGRATLADVREQRALSVQVEAWQEAGMTTLPTALLEGVSDGRTNVAQFSSDVRTAVALLADLGRQLMQVDNANALVNLRFNQIAQQINLARQSLTIIAASRHAHGEQVVLAESLRGVIDRLDGLMVGRDDSVYALRQQQLALAVQERQALDAVAAAMLTMRELLEDVEADTVRQADAAATQSEELASAGWVLQVAVTLVVILMLAVFGWRTMVRVLTPLGQMRRQMESISGTAGGNADLAMRLELDRDDEIGRTAQAFNRMMDTFAGVVARISDSAGVVASSSRQIAAGNEDLSQRTEEQTASLAETASSLEEITTTVRQTADYADQARNASDEVGRRARSAGDVAGRTNAAMTDIRDASERITTIVTAIDEIAFQTNLLALNASVEAARAGEQGRGFAVVAAEVRKLASRSAEEAAQIRRLVSDTVSKVGEGANLVVSTSDHLQEIIGSLSRVSSYVNDIARATQEQSAGIEQINQAIVQLDQVAHQNARLVQEATNASRTLDERAADMQLLVGHFRTKARADDGGGGRRSLSLPAAETVAEQE